MTVEDERMLMKNGLGRPALRAIATNIVRVHPDFDERAFVRAASKGLAALELRGRVDHIAAVLRRQLPDDFLPALDVLVRTSDGWDPGDVPEPSFFVAWPLVELVGTYGLDHFDASMDALTSLTRIFSAEFAIRPFLDADPKAATKYLERWTRHEDEHVRRLVSEGTRPRLPWGRRLRVFGKDPQVTLRLLERLRDDPSETVRRSVANHLNDLAKSDPELVLERCRMWSNPAGAKRASPERLGIIRHALRTLVKAGDPEAMRLLGYSPDAQVEVRRFTVSPPSIRLGQAVCLGFELRSRSKVSQKLMVDYAVHHVKADGRRTPKVFKLKVLSLEPEATLRIEKKHPIREISTRRYHSGRHAVELLINGRSTGVREFDLEV